MYTKVKELVKAVLPKQALFKYEPLFRGILYQFYRGRNYQCVVCQKKLDKFIQLADGDKLCPRCGSLSRARRLWTIVKQKITKPGVTILDFSPSRSLYRALKKNTAISYVSTDISGDFMSDFQYDITAIDAAAECYDLILCYHILEHVEDDRSAMRELYRVLKKGGTCLVQTPFKEGNTYEDSSVKTEAGRLQHFGQKDHVRIYSVAGLENRLAECGFHVAVKNYEEPADNYYGFKPNETVLLCTK